jgi:predicted transcriptional regulator
VRTTLTLDDDLATALERLRAERDGSFKGVVNDALRAGIAQLEAVDSASERFETESVSHGRSLIGDLDDISAVLAIAEGDDHR